MAKFFNNFFDCFNRFFRLLAPFVFVRQAVGGVGLLLPPKTTAKNTAKNDDGRKVDRIFKPSKIVA
jgi:hypothetical protein